ncbi:RraA family protein [Streptomyces purpurogeneiscleroticus]|uniref:RraA family protein n=1 Tax=Streptomyces purpurogeneiscleroticus TaxID=68259 RepID=UPI001CBED505|nr:RraA family protein [Streptomyces purpurogeneiscleroticus]MBZ4017641.1 dimethylmenaquinone methyltransferase [Streptomyces purpurogeneiscleroticus]
MSECRLNTSVTDPRQPRPSANLLRRLVAVPTAALSDAMLRLPGAVGVLPVGGPLGECRMAGPALTVRTRPGDNLVVHKAVDLARPGDVLVIDAGGDTSRAIVGDLLCRYAASRGLAGIVLDGAARDVAELRELDLPIFARAVSHLGPYKNGPGEIGGPVSIGGLPVSHGDLMVGDDDGVLALAPARAEHIVSDAEALVAREEQTIAAIKSGTWDRSWVDAALTITPLDDIRE